MAFHALTHTHLDWLEISLLQELTVLYFVYIICMSILYDYIGYFATDKLSIKDFYYYYYHYCCCCCCYYWCFIRFFCVLFMSCVLSCLCAILCYADQELNKDKYIIYGESPCLLLPLCLEHCWPQWMWWEWNDVLCSSFCCSRAWMASIWNTMDTDIQRGLKASAGCWLW